MRKIINLFLVVIMLFSFSVPVFAWSGSEWWDNLASEEIRTNAPQSATPSHQRNMMLYNNKDGLYYKIQNTGTASGNNSYYINSESGIVYQTGNQKTFNIFKYENSVWSQVSLEDGTKVFETYDISDYLLVSNTAKVFIDDTSYSFSPETGELIVNGEVIEKPEEDDNTTDDGEDISNSGLLGGIKDLFSPVVDLVDFLFSLFDRIGDFFSKLWETLQRIPVLIESLESMLDTESSEGIIYSFKQLIYDEDNQYSTAIFSLVILFLGFTVFCVVSYIIKKFTFKE